MARAIPYSAARDDLFFPCKRGAFFQTGLPASEAALCAEMSRLAYCRQNGSFGFDQNAIRNVLRGIGFTQCQFFESAGRPQGRGTHSFLAGRPDAEPVRQLAIVVFRGTDKDDPTDIQDDADALFVQWPRGGRVHVGFAGALEEVADHLSPALQAVACRLLYTGHSLGAALATLLASQRRPGALYTFGSPLVGDADFVSTLRGLDCRRYVDCCDLVTRVPPELLGYAHVGSPYYIDRSGAVTFNPGDASRVADQLGAREEYLVQYAWKDGSVPIRDLADHAPINYVSADL
jgi:hypothetical protein